MLAAMSKWSLFDDDDDDGDDDDGDETNDHKKLRRWRRHDDVYHNVRWMTIECACYHSSTNLTRLVWTLYRIVCNDIDDLGDDHYYEDHADRFDDHDDRFDDHDDHYDDQDNHYDDHDDWWSLWWWWALRRSF